ncbi:YhdT family protein [Streptobacillus moniliformis]|uniref:YhdT family protein n=1 Tax=Streptobacillus moniliformis TaxID=34105 RepID=UPI0007E43D08|nr:YhdT family protein [Streptobacillus moniliformis]
MKKQIDKEALITSIIYLIYFVWWYYFAYIYPPKNVEEYKYILGLPEWFLYSCIVGFIWVNIAVFAVIKIFFKNIYLDTGDINE